MDEKPAVLTPMKLSIQDRYFAYELHELFVSVINKQDESIVGRLDPNLFSDLVRKIEKDMSVRGLISVNMQKKESDG